MIRSEIERRLIDYNKRYPNQQVDLVGLSKVRLEPIISPLAVLHHRQGSGLGPNDSVGYCSVIDHHVSITPPVDLGQFVHIAPSVTIGGGNCGSITIGNFSGIGANSQLYTGSDTPEDVFTVLPHEFGIKKGVGGSIVMESYTAIGCGSFVAPNQFIPEGVFIGVQSRVSSSYAFEPWTIYVNKDKKLVPLRERTIEEKNTVIEQGRRASELLEICLAIKKMPPERV